MKQERIELNDRFIQALDWLESTGEITRYSHRKEEAESKSYTDLAQIMGDGVSNLPTSRIADFRNRKRFVDYPEAIRFAKEFNIRKEWMCFGEGPMTPGMMIVDIETEGIIAVKCDNDFREILNKRFEVMQYNTDVYGFTK